VSSAMLAFAFVFGSTAATMFRGLVMIFSTNPFGVGDWVRVNDDTLMVKELGLNIFVCENFWGENVYVPVGTMLDTSVFNLSRSPPLWMRYSFHVDIGMSPADFDHVQVQLSAHIDSDNTNYTQNTFNMAGLYPKP
jgi:small-conductance mechanosensitive channel